MHSPVLVVSFFGGGGRWGAESPHSRASQETVYKFKHDFSSEVCVEGSDEHCGSVTVSVVGNDHSLVF